MWRDDNRKLGKRRIPVQGNQAWRAFGSPRGDEASTELATTRIRSPVQDATGAEARSEDREQRSVTIVKKGPHRLRRT